MPELPEVETTVRMIRPQIRGRRIVSLWSDTPRLFRGSSREAVVKAARGKTIQDVSRRGKNIVLHLSGGHDLLIHLMMSGRLLVEKKPPTDRYVHFWMKLGTGKYLALHDTRKFGWIRLLHSHDHAKLKLGPDALAISFSEFHKILCSRSGKIKTLLLNQSLISGLGNIYSDEALWHAGIHPLRRGNSLKLIDARKLFDAIQRVLKLAVKKEGSSMRSYRTPEGNEGGYFKIRKVYHRTGEKCSRDGAIIQRIVVGQRSAHFCPKHQV